MNRMFWWSLILLVQLAPLTAVAAHAADSDVDDDEEATPAPRKRQSLKKRQAYEEAEADRRERERSLAGFDDPNVGLSAEWLVGLFLNESTRGGGFEPRFLTGARATWEWSRTAFRTELLRELFFLDITWGVASSHDGTQVIYTDATNHFVTFAPAFSWPLPGLGSFSPIAVYGQVGAGLNMASSTATAQMSAQAISALRFVFQYGGGVRFRLPLSPEGGVRFSGRLEFTRFRRAYMDDTLIGGSLGLLF